MNFVAHRTVKHRIAGWISAAVLGVALIPAPTQADEAKPTDAKPESVSVFGIGNLTVPTAFKRTKPRNRIIQHEFVATAKEIDVPARVTMMGASGGVEANIKRWKGQFTGGEAEKQKTETFKEGDWTIHLVDCSGDFAESMGGGPFAPGRTVMRPKYAMAGAILLEPKGRTFFVKMIGPEKVVETNRKLFVEMIKSIDD